MSSRRDPPTTSGGNGASRSGPAAPAERELIVVADPGARLRATPSGIAAADATVASTVSAKLDELGISMRPLFDVSEERMMQAAIDEVTSPGAPASQPHFALTQYFRVEAPDARLDDIAAQLRALPAVQAAYVKPPTYPAAMTKTPATGEAAMRPYTPTVTKAIETLNDQKPRAEEAAPTTPSFVARQGYLNPAPAGIDAVFAATQPGGRGANVRIIDIEGAWRFTHEDLVANQGGVVAGTPSSDIGWRNHGTAVMGEFGGDLNAIGITGICPDANARGISIFGGLGSAPAIRKAADLLSPGDIILIELHRPGPHATGAGQVGFIAIEWWPDDFDAIRYASTKGVLVVEAAGNGAENLNDPVYDAPAPGFPASWSNPFRRGTRDSGAILVGAGAPPPGTHGRDHGPDRSRLDFSNYGTCVDAQGWGREVTTTGYGDLQGGSNEDFWYTDQFSGTSSASPIVVGALGCVQGNRKARGLAPLTPAAARNLLRTTGSPQQDAPGRPASQRIGNRPNLRQMIGGGVTLTVPLFRYWNPGNSDHFYTTNWAELGAGRYGWGYEGIQCYVVPQQVPGTVPLYRYWNAGIGDHFYTTDWAELGAGRYGWGYEGIQSYVYTVGAPDRVPLYRYWNPAAGDHFYTTNWGELGAGRYGWYFERVQCYVATQVRPPELGEGAEAPLAEAGPAGDEGASSQEPEGRAARDSGAFGEGQASPLGSGMGGTGGVLAETPPSFAASRTGEEAGGAPGASFAGAGRASSFEMASKPAAKGATITIRLGGEG